MFLLDEFLRTLGTVVEARALDHPFQL